VVGLEGVLKRDEEEGEESEREQGRIQGMIEGVLLRLSRATKRVNDMLE